MVTAIPKKVQQKKNHTTLITIMIIVFVTFAAIVFLVLFKNSIQNYRGQHSYKYHSKIRKIKNNLAVSATQNCNDEFSEVRFLTSDDENLDIVTLATSPRALNRNDNARTTRSRQPNTGAEGYDQI